MKNNKTTELAANTNLAGWKIISRSISLREFRESANSAVLEVGNEVAMLPSAFSTRTLFIFAKTKLLLHHHYIVSACVMVR